MQLETRYARQAGAHIAYQVCGRGAIDLLFIPGLISHLDLEWEDTAYRSFVLRLSRMARVIRYDKRGNGLSDPVDSVPSMEQRCADAVAVLDATGSTSAVILGHCEGGPIALRMAVEHPQRVRGLVLYGTGARATPPEAIAAFRSAVACWGTGATLDMFAGSLAGDQIARSARGRLERAAASPQLALATFEALGHADAQHYLDQIQLPTLVVHRRDDMVPIAEGRLLADRIEGARFVELEGGDHLPWVGDTDRLLNAIEPFISNLNRHAASVAAVASRRTARPFAGVASLTLREREVAELVARGMSNPEISRQLFVSRHTVESHLKNISAKLGVQGRAKVMQAIRSDENP